MGRGAHDGMVCPAGRLQPLWDGPLYRCRDSDHMNTVGEPYSGKPNVRFDEGRPGEALPTRAAYSTQDRQHRAVWQGPQDLEGFGQRTDLLAAENGTDGVHRGGGQLGEVGQRPVLDFATLAIGLTDQDRAVLAAALAAGYYGYVHGTGWTLRHIQIVAC